VSATAGAERASPLRSEADAGLSRRFIETGSGPRLSAISLSGEPGRVPVLFVHGAFGGAWHWAEHFLPAAAREGRRAIALDLRGHGESEGFDKLEGTSLAHFEEDVALAAASFERPPIIVAHSLGGLIAQRLIGRVPMSGLALLASLPPEGMFFVGPRFAVTNPLTWAEALVGSFAKSSPPISDAARRLLFGEGLPPDLVDAYAERMRPESPRALADAHTPGPIASAFLHRVPSLVIGGALDRLIWRPSTLRTALYHGAGHRTVAGMGHFLPLDRGAEHVAAGVLGWMNGIAD
jgi:pimeloyl-ACP methyl ester carboxylesterase